jgi:S1-C subfamily serine protease
VRVYLKDGRELGAKIIYISPSYDFSLLKIDTIDPLPAITWADSEQLSLGQEVVTIGHSALLNETISGGVIIGWGTRTTEQGDTVEVLQLNINHYPGDSGGPVFDREGRLAGLMNARRTQKDRATLAVPVNKIHFAYLNLAPGTQNK